MCDNCFQYNMTIIFEYTHYCYYYYEIALLATCPILERRRSMVVLLVYTAHDKHIWLMAISSGSELEQTNRMNLTYRCLCHSYSNDEIVFRCICILHASRTQINNNVFR